MVQMLGWLSADAARAALKAFQGVGSRRECGRQEFHRDRTHETHVFRLEDDAHAARAERFEDPVMRNGAPDHRFPDGAGV